MAFKHVKIGAAAAVLSAGLLAGCADAPKQGTVISTEYDRAHYDETIYCAQYDQRSNCTLWLPAQNWVPDEWSLKLEDRTGKHVKRGWRDVPQADYSRCGMGAEYPDCAAGR